MTGIGIRVVIAAGVMTELNFGVRETLDAHDGMTSQTTIILSLRDLFPEL